MEKTTRGKRNITWIALLLALLAINLLASFVHFRFDFTEEKRYSLSKPTQDVLKNLNGPVRIDVFLKGDFPAGFRKLSNSVEEFLIECKDYSRGNLQYNFVNPLEGL